MIGFEDYSKSEHFDKGEPFKNVANANGIVKKVKTFFADLNAAHDNKWRVSIITKSEKLNEELDSFKGSAKLFEANKMNNIVIFYVGHGCEIDGHTYIVKPDFHPDKASEGLYNITDFINCVKPLNHMNVVAYLDCCREKPKDASIAAQVKKTGAFNKGKAHILFACQSG